MTKQQKLSMASLSIGYKLRIAAYLMSIIPLLVCVYLVSNYVVPHFGYKLDIVFSIGITVFLAFIGYRVIKGIINRIVVMSTNARKITGGDLGQGPDSQYPDEIGVLNNALNQLTARIRGNMNELQGYGEKTTEINLEIQKRVFVLSSLMQISSLISQEAKLDDTLRLIVEKSKLLANSEAAFMFFKPEEKDEFEVRFTEGSCAQSLVGITVDPNDAPFCHSINVNKMMLMDAHTKRPEETLVNFLHKLGFKNALIMPVHTKGNTKAALGVGNNRNGFTYNREDIELMDIFSKQVAVAIESDQLMHRVEKLEIKDTLTGLYNETYIRGRLQEEIKRAIAYQRPCSMVLIDVDNCKRYHDSFGLLATETALKKVGALIKDSVSDIDRVGRIADDEFAVLLPERNKRQAHEIAENIRKKIEFGFSEEPDTNRRISVSAGVSENPLDGIDASALIASAKDLVRFAKQQGKNRIVSFKEPPVCR